MCGMCAVQRIFLNFFDTCSVVTAYAHVLVWCVCNAVGINIFFLFFVAPHTQCIGVRHIRVCSASAVQCKKIPHKQYGGTYAWGQG